MKNILIISSALVIMGASASIYGEYESEDFTWTENSNGAQLLQETGSLNKITIGYQSDSKTTLRIDTQLTLMNGTVDYNGQTQSGIPASTQVDYDGFSIQTGFKTGSGWLNNTTTEGNMFLGIKHSQWDRSLRSTNTAIGYVEEWTSTEIIARAGFEPKGRKGLYGYVEASIPVMTDMSVNLSEVGLGQVSVKPEGTLGIGGELGYKATDYFSLGINYRLQQFDESDPVFVSSGTSSVSISQPESIKKTLGLKMNLIF